MDDLLSACPALVPWLEKTTELSGYLWDKGWAERNAGNLSIDVTDLVAAEGSCAAELTRRQLPFAYPKLAGRLFLVTGSGHRFRDLAHDAAHHACVLWLSDDGRAFQLIWGGEDDVHFRPTSEFPAHLRVHEFLRERGAAERVVLHTHPTELIVLTHLPEYQNEVALNRVLWGAHPEVKVTVPRGVGLAPYIVPGSEELALATVAALRRDHPVAVWPMHGIVAVGRDVMEAFDLIDTLNKAAQIILLARGAGGFAAGLSDAQLAELVRAFNLKD